MLEAYGNSVYWGALPERFSILFGHQLACIAGDFNGFAITLRPFEWVAGADYRASYPML